MVYIYLNDWKENWGTSFDITCVASVSLVFQNEDMCYCLDYDWLVPIWRLCAYQRKKFVADFYFVVDEFLIKPSATI